MSQPAVLIVEDDTCLRDALLETLADGEHPVLSATNGHDALKILNAEDVGLVVSDLQMQPMSGRELLAKIRDEHPATPAVLMTAYGTIEDAVEEMRRGAADYLVKPFDADVLRGVVARHLKAVSHSSQPIAEDPAARRLLGVARRVAATEVTVTLSGESGCGKEVFARYIHQESPRAAGPFVAINCAAIPDNMLEAVLFGYEKGAFTGASAAHPGKFEQAAGGTLLLDEISEMDLGLQAKLLRVLQEREVERIGGRQVIPLDVRVLATTNRNLKSFVADGHFPRRSLLSAERFSAADPAAARASSRHRAAGTGDPEENMQTPGQSVPHLSQTAEDALLRHTWPGNVRELENTLQRSLILLQGDTIRGDDLVFEGAESSAVTSVGNSTAALQDDLKHREFRLVVQALEEAQGNRKLAATSLGISPRTLRYKLARMREEGFWQDDKSHVGGAASGERGGFRNE